jgi:hypothetical protein
VRTARRLAVVQDAPAEALERARAATRAAAEALEKAKAAEVEATAAYDLDDDLADAAGRATAARAKCERVLSRRQGEEQAALQAVRQADRARLGGELDAALRFLADMHFRELDGLVELDRQASVIVDKIADRIAEAEEVHQRATSLGAELGRAAEVQRTARCPTLTHVALLGRVLISRDRKATGRDLADGWLQSAPQPAWNDVRARPSYDAAVAELDRMQKKGSK